MDFEIKVGDSSSPADQVRALAQARLGGVVETLESVIDKPEKAVHSARKDLKKLRGIARLVRDSIGRKPYKKTNKALRDAGRELAVYRDHYVRLQILGRLRSEDLDPALDKSLETAERKLAEIYEKNATAKALETSADKAIKLLKDARGRIDDWPLDEDQSFKIFRHGLERVYSRAHRGLATSLARPSVGNLHDWRKRCKYLRHQLKLLRPCWPEILDVHEDELHRLTNHLGDDHDLAVLRETLEGDLRDILDRPTLAALNELIADRHRAHLDAAWPLARKLFAERPRAFVERTGTYWEATT